MYSIKQILPVYLVFLIIVAACHHAPEAPCGSNYFCYQGHRPLKQKNLKPGTVETLQKMGITLRDTKGMEGYAEIMLNKLKEPPLRAYGQPQDAARVWIIRCSLLPSFHDLLSVVIQISPTEKAMLRAKRYQKVKWKQGGVSAPAELHTAERHLMPDEINELSESFRRAADSWLRTPLLPVGIDDIFIKDGETWIFESMSPQGYLAAARMDDQIEPEFRRLCQGMFQMSPLTMTGQGSYP